MHLAAAALNEMLYCLSCFFCGQSQIRICSLQQLNIIRQVHWLCLGITSEFRGKR